MSATEGSLEKTPILYSVTASGTVSKKKVRNAHVRTMRLCETWDLFNSSGPVIFLSFNFCFVKKNVFILNKICLLNVFHEQLK